MKFILLSFFLSLPALAGFHGRYSGKGLAVFHSGNRYECTEIFLRLETSATEFQLQEGGYNCGFLKASFDAFKLSIRNGKLYHKEQELGSISQNEIKYSIYDPEDGSTYFLTLKLNDSQEISYDERWYDGQKWALTLKGNLLPLSE